MVAARQASLSSDNSYYVLLFTDTNDGTSKKGRGNKNKPMSPDDYKKVESELQRHLASGRVQQQQRMLHTQYMAMGMQDVMTQSIGRSTETPSVRPSTTTTADVTHAVHGHGHAGRHDTVYR